MTASARCRLLQTAMPHTPIARCPSGMTTFHYHARDPRAPIDLISRFASCGHRHTRAATALECAARNAQEVK